MPQYLFTCADLFEEFIELAPFTNCYNCIKRLRKLAHFMIK